MAAHLVVTNFSGTLTNAQTFQLFVATNGNYSAGTFANVTLPAAPGLSWTTNLAVNGTITAVVVAGDSTPTPTYHPSFSVSGTESAIINGTNGTAGWNVHYRWWPSTNVAVAADELDLHFRPTHFWRRNFQRDPDQRSGLPNAPQSFYSIKQTCIKGQKQAITSPSRSARRWRQVF